MIHVYVDASGSESNPRNDVLVAAGFAGTTEDWKRLERPWASALSEAHAPLKTYHANKLHVQANRGEGGWDFEKLDALKRRLTDVLVGCGLSRRAYGSGIYRRDFDAVNARYNLEDPIGGMYALACAGLVRNWRWHKSRSVLAAASQVTKFHFEAGDAGQDKLQQLLSGDPLGNSAVYMPKRFLDANGCERYVRPFESADFLAYEIRRARMDVDMGLPEEEWRRSGRRLDRRIEPRVTWPTLGEQLAMCRATAAIQRRS